MLRHILTVELTSEPSNQAFRFTFACGPNLLFPLDYTSFRGLNITMLGAPSLSKEVCVDKDMPIFARILVYVSLIPGVGISSLPSEFSVPLRCIQKFSDKHTSTQTLHTIRII